MKIRLKNVAIHKYKCVEDKQTFNVNKDITILVGMNESGKTSILEAIAKSNYFSNDDEFKFNMTHDYPRKQKKAVDKSGENPIAVELTYELSEELINEIETDMNIKHKGNIVSVITKYNNSNIIKNGAFSIDKSKFLENYLKEINFTDSSFIDTLCNISNQTEFEKEVSKIKENISEDDIKILNSLKKYFKNTWEWDNPIEEYLWQQYIETNLPKFMYYDDYYVLPSRIKLDNLNNNQKLESCDKTAKALLELADIDINKLLLADEYEDFRAELEATQAIISEELFKYWNTNKNLRIMFDIDKKEKKDARNNTNIVEHILDIRVQNIRNMVSLPLKNRSKGFNWFFSFLVWFKKIQEDNSKSYILLLDEPGLNLHAMAQYDLLQFINDLVPEYQIIYTTHSPFMVETESLNQVRTIVETDKGTVISDCLQEKDPNTLFPLQAALGYTIAQNLFISKNNLLVEGIADLVYLNILSSILDCAINDDITIVPTGGAEKVASFISLMRGNKLNIVCLLDSFTEQGAKAKLDNIIKQKLIKDKNILFYCDILGVDFADVEDMFQKEDYLKLYNGAFGKNIKIEELDNSKPIMEQLKKLNNNKKFNHYLPAKYLLENTEKIDLSETTINNFKKLFDVINKKF